MALRARTRLRNGPASEAAEEASFDATTYGTLVYHADFTNAAKVLTAGGGVATDGQVIDTITDSSASAINLQQTNNTYRPVCQTNEVQGYQVARFDGGDGFPVPLANSSTISKNRAGLTIALTVKFSSFNAGRVVKLSDSASGTRVFVYVQGTSGRLAVEVKPQDGGVLQQLYGDLSFNPDLVNWWIYVVKADFAGNSLKSWLNNDVTIDDVDIGSSGSSSNTDATGADGNHIMFNHYGSNGVAGDIGELLIYNAALADGTISNLITGLASKYGVSL